MGDFQYQTPNGIYEAFLYGTENDIQGELTAPSGAKILIRFIDGHPTSRLIAGYGANAREYGNMAIIPTIYEALTDEEHEIAIRALADFRDKH